jgi:hypothetical protein
VVGYYRPVRDWNEGKKEEFADRRPYSPAELVESMTSAETREMGRTG